jgi:hypothetical protein
MLSICSVAVRKTYALFLLYIFMSMSCVLIAIYNRMSVDVSIQVYVCGGISCYWSLCLLLLIIMIKIPVVPFLDCRRLMLSHLLREVYCLLL